MHELPHQRDIARVQLDPDAPARRPAAGTSSACSSIRPACCGSARMSRACNRPRRCRWGSAPGTRRSVRHRRRASSWSFYRDGVLILNQWVANTGTAPIGGSSSATSTPGRGRRTTTPWSSTDLRESIPPGHHPADHARPTERAPAPSDGRIDLTWSGFDRSVAADHVPDLPRRRCEPDRSDDRHDVQRHGARRRVVPHLCGGCGRRGDAPTRAS